ncbi:pseudouridine synthase, partial [Pseudomonas aeruginosa]
DRDTSGVLLVAKKRSALRSLHEQLREKGMQKDYLALVRGQWQSHVKSVQAPLLKNILQTSHTHQRREHRDNENVNHRPAAYKLNNFINQMHSFTVALAVSFGIPTQPRNGDHL